MKRIVAAFLMVIMIPVMPAQAKDFIEVEVTYYIPTGNLTKTETVPKEGRTIAVDPELIPLGSCVALWDEEGEFLGYFEAEDTGSEINGADIDVFKECSKKEALELGRHKGYAAVYPEAVG